MKTATKSQEAERDLAIRLLEDLQTVDLELARREVMGNPLWYGLPDLLFGRGEKAAVSRVPTEVEEVLGELDGTAPGLIVSREKFDESEDDWKKRQNAAIRRMIEKHLWVTKDARRIEIRVIEPMVEFVADLFFKRTRRAILWKPRGGGGSLSAAVLIWLFLVYRQTSVLDVAGSQEQARVIYHYVTEFWDCVPEMKRRILSKMPTMTETHLITGCLLKCVPATEKQARGKHMPILVADESCQGDESADRSLRAAMSGVTSEVESVVVLLSTFHIPSGLFQEYWDFATDKGFSRYKWDVFDTMAACTVGLETATKEDPKALAHCRKCPLTWLIDERDERGIVVTQRMSGCGGKARDSVGWATYGQTLDARKLHLGTNVFEIEYACNRPNWMRTVYDPELVDKTEVDEIDVEPMALKCVGIDWGFETVGSMALVLGTKCPEYVGVPEAILTDHVQMRDIITQLEEWRDTYGAFVIFADKSHPFNNAELAQAGFAIELVDFGTMKSLGIQNVQRYLVSRRLKILSEFRTGREQMKNLRRTERGSIVKKGEHFCDALLAMLLYFRFDEHWPADMGRDDKEAPKEPSRGLSTTEVSPDGSVVLI